MKTLFAETALTPAGWTTGLRITVDAAGTITGCAEGFAAAGDEVLAGPVVPGMPNLHSHAFQRAMAGLAERASGTPDSFWTWRELMYRFVSRLEPEDVAAVAAQLYVEMLEAGYTAVGEFHYLHHDPGGERYDDRALLSEAVIAAAAEAGIGMTLLPVLYEAGGFGGKPPGAAQRRFVDDVDGICGLVETLRTRHGGNPEFRVGLAPHSLRAVPPASLVRAVATLRKADPTAPIHIHVAEQRREVEECEAWSGKRPVAFLLETAEVDRHWCLVHATHVDARETAALARSGAVAGICPTTEGNLGDGFFPVVDYVGAGGAWGIGSDSHVSISPPEELRWLEYGQRLLKERRTLATAGEAGSTGARLWQDALAGGARALGRPIGAIAPGCRADLVVLDPEAPALAGRSGDQLLDTLVFAGIGGMVRDVMVGGAWRVREGRHPARRAVADRYRRALARLVD